MKSRKEQTLRKRTSVRSKFPKEGYRLSVHRSNRYLFAQIIDLRTGKTIMGISDKTSSSKEKVVDKTSSSKEKVAKAVKAKNFGLEFAKQALKNKIKKVVFDRGSFRYHGRIEKFAEGVREGGLEF